MLLQGTVSKIKPADESTESRLCRYCSGITMIDELSKHVLVSLVLNFFVASFFLSKMLHVTFSNI